MHWSHCDTWKLFVPISVSEVLGFSVLSSYVTAVYELCL